MTADQTRPAMTFREARDAGLLPPVLALALPQDSDAGTDPTDRSFAAYLTAQERDQLDARAATAEAERDEATEDRDGLRAENANLTAGLRRLREQLADMTDQRNERLTLAESSRLAKRYDEALEARDVLRQRLEAMKAEKKRVLGRLEMAEHVIDLMRDGREQQDRTLATWDTTPGDAASSVPSRRAQEDDEPRRERQPAYDAVYRVIAAAPPRSADDYGRAYENARVWRAVEAALDVMEQLLAEARP